MGRSLDQRGDISAALVAVYVPIFVAALLLTLRHGFGRGGGWVFLLIFSVVRVVGAALQIAAELVPNPSTGLYVTAFSLETAGVAPLLLCTLSFLMVVGDHSLASGENSMIPPIVFRVIRMIISVAFIISIIGGTKAADTSPSSISEGAKMRKAGSLVVIIMFVVIVGIHFLFWANKDRILRRRRTLLAGVSAALPFLTVRLVYSVLSAFSPSVSFISGVPAQKPNSLSKFNTLSGEWETFLFMGQLMEFFVVCTYLTVGTLIPLKDEDKEALIEKGQEL